MINQNTMSIRIVKIDTGNEIDVELVNKIAVYAFHKSPNTSELERRLKVAHYRSDTDQFLLYDEEEPVASAAIHPLTQNVRGKIVQIGGVATVGSLPHSRRKGHVSKLMQHMMTYMKENNIAISLLHPFRESFYQRYGYMSLPDRFHITIKTDSLRQLRHLQLETTLKFERLDNNFEEFEKFLKKVQALQPGMIMFSSNKLKQLLENEYWLVRVFDKKDECVAIMTYDIEGYEKGLSVEHFLYTTSQGKYSLLQFLMNHIDHVKTIDMPLRQNENFGNWFGDKDYSVSIKSGAMARIISIRDLTALKLKAGKGEILIKIVDDMLDWNNGNYLIRSNNGFLEITEYEGSDIVKGTLQIAGLSALIFGNYKLGDLQILKQIEISSDYVSILDNVFRYETHEVLTYF